MNRLLLLLLAFAASIVPLIADPLEEGQQRLDHLCELYNSDQNNQLIKQAHDDMNFHEKHQLWNQYYETWMHMVNTYVFSGKVNTALKEVKEMHAHALKNNSRYGQALAYYTMGNTYFNMGYLEQSIACYRKSLQLIDKVGNSPAVVNDIFSYYCDALSEQKDFRTMQAVTHDWKEFLDAHANLQDASAKSIEVWTAYYFLACAQSHLGLGLYDAAAADIDEAERRAEGHGDFIPMSVLYFRGQLYLLQHDYEKALKCSDEGLTMTMTYDDKSSMLLVWEQRAAILKGLGRFEEAAEMYKNAYELTDSVYKKDSRTQLNELSTLFHVREMEREKELAHTRTLNYTMTVIAIALALLLAYGAWTSRKLRQKNSELALARDKAQESSRMKSDFIKNISHEIRTPLNIVSGFSQILASDTDLPADIRKESSLKIQESTARITTLINQLLALSESSSRNHIDRNDLVSVNRLCHQAIARSGLAEDEHHQFSFTTDIADDFMALTSEQSAIMALCSLLDNAMKFTPKGGAIGLHCSHVKKRIFISVEDTGCGVPEEKSESIFTEFVQLDEYKEGVGVGLTLARNIARLLGGDIVLDTNYKATIKPGMPDGHGARFLFSLPV